MMGSISGKSDPDLDRMRDRALFIRTETVRLISIAKIGHYASTFSCAEILAVLYYGVMRLRPGEPRWSGRDRFLMGKGHAAVGLYPVLADLGFFDRSLLDGYTRLGSPLGDHPDMTKVAGVDFSSGSLGHNLSVGTGIALGARLTSQNFRVFVLMGDGEQNEGQIWEAAMFAAHHRLTNLIGIIDRNQYSLDGKVEEVSGIEPLADKWRAFGWQVLEVDGHDVSALASGFQTVLSDPNRDAPALIIAHTVKGKGVKYMEESFGWHLGWLEQDDEADALAELRAQR